jgi:hypothetical protein
MLSMGVFCLVAWCVRTVPLDNTLIHNIISTAPQLSISQKALGMLPEDGNVMPKHVVAILHTSYVNFNTSYHLEINSIRQLITSCLRTKILCSSLVSPICFVYVAVFDSLNEIMFDEVYT